MPREGMPRTRPGDILRYEEILRLVRIGTTLGIRKIRITGGEPLARRGIADFIASLRSQQEIVDCCLTTNGVLLKDLAGPLKASGLDRVTVSLDSLRRERYEQITGLDALDRVLQGIEASLAAGLVPVKINVVVIKGMNEDEIVDFSRLSIHDPLEIRFIERMPLGEDKREDTRGCGLWEKEVLSGQEVLRRVEEELGPLEPASPVVPLPGPARLYRIPGSKGRIGLITPMTHPFCDSCTRLRLTPDGKLRACLFSNAEIDIRELLRSGEDDDRLREAFERSIGSKQRHKTPDFSENKRWMAEIGG